jgi:hypothetical protein
MRFVLFALALGCSSVSSEEATVDAVVDSESSDTTVAVDSTTTTDTMVVNETMVVDSAKVDSTTTETMPPGDTGICRPFWCGCGSCVPQEIICTKSAAGCPLGCPSGPCPDMERADICTTIGDRCQRNGISGDIACLSSADCPPGSCCSGTFTPPGKGKCGPC